MPIGNTIIVKAIKKIIKIVTNVNKLVDTARLLAYPKDPDEAKYPSRKPKDEYKEALHKVYLNRKSW